eukprot:5874100-Amphidinium_carterae.1
MQADVTSTDHFGVQTDIIRVHATDGTTTSTGHSSAHSSEWEPQRSTGLLGELMPQLHQVASMHKSPTRLQQASREELELLATIASSRGVEKMRALH